MKRSISVASLALATALLSACGGGGGGSALPASSLAGNAIDGPVNGATVAAYSISNGAKGVLLANATTDAAGHFTLDLGSYAGAVMLQVSGGSYLDDATGATTPMASGTVMTAVVQSIGAGGALEGIQITPVTSMAQVYAQGMSGGMTDANIATANAALGNYFGITGSSDLLHTVPIDPRDGGSGIGVPQASVNYGMVMAAMSQYANAQGLTNPSAVITAYMNDAGDGVMNGLNSGAQVMMGGGGMAAMSAFAGTSGLASAMSSFVSSAQNQSGVTAAQMQDLMSNLTSSNGAL
ncbi:hypothetical protein GALL_261220 [mine drainage metagenome]|jgi:hypothetical protein|uniref:Uncharacterized protein n=1 Tax=mine drainage metagenome TaxID=410659 RepID=A0A1J5R9F2_9ZZZZ